MLAYLARNVSSTSTLKPSLNASGFMAVNLRFSEAVVPAPTIAICQKLPLAASALSRDRLRCKENAGKPALGARVLAGCTFPRRGGGHGLLRWYCARGYGVASPCSAQHARISISAAPAIEAIVSASG